MNKRWGSFAIGLTTLVLSSCSEPQEMESYNPQTRELRSRPGAYKIEFQSEPTRFEYAKFNFEDAATGPAEDFAKKNELDTIYGYELNTPTAKYVSVYCVDNLKNPALASNALKLALAPIKKQYNLLEYSREPAQALLGRTGLIIEGRDGKYDDAAYFKLIVALNPAAGVDNIWFVQTKTREDLKTPEVEKFFKSMESISRGGVSGF